MANEAYDTNGRADGLEYPVEFELRVIYELSYGSAPEEALARVLAARGAALEAPRRLPSSGQRYGRLACRVRFETQDALYAAYAEAGAIPGVKTIL